MPSFCSFLRAATAKITTPPPDFARKLSRVAHTRLLLGLGLAPTWRPKKYPCKPHRPLEREHCTFAAGPSRISSPPPWPPWKESGHGAHLDKCLAKPHRTRDGVRCGRREAAISTTYDMSSPYASLNVQRCPIPLDFCAPLPQFTQHTPRRASPPHMHPHLSPVHPWGPPCCVRRVALEGPAPFLLSYVLIHLFPSLYKYRLATPHRARSQPARQEGRKKGSVWARWGVRRRWRRRTR